jgi:hydroxymethylpyrimidine/phosphomethylpyrimidine kinase
LGVYGATVVTAVTAQNTCGVRSTHQVPPDIITDQIEAVFADLDIRAIKTGMIGDEGAAAAIADALERLAGAVPIVVDPVMVSTSGSRLLARGAEILLARRLIPLAALVTPNLLESAALLNCGVARTEDEAKEQARRLFFAFRPGAVLLKGGHSDWPEAVDFFFDGRVLERLSLPRVNTVNTHGTGCTLASAIAAFLAKGADLREAVHHAKRYLHKALQHADRLNIGRGHGPVFHFHDFLAAK